MKFVTKNQSKWHIFTYSVFISSLLIVKGQNCSFQVATNCQTIQGLFCIYKILCHLVVVFHIFSSVLTSIYKYRTLQHLDLRPSCLTQFDLISDMRTFSTAIVDRSIVLIHIKLLCTRLFKFKKCKCVLDFGLSIVHIQMQYRRFRVLGIKQCESTPKFTFLKSDLYVIFITGMYRAAKIINSSSGPLL